MSRVNAPLSSEIAAVAALADGSLTIGFECVGGEPARLLLRLSADEVAKLALILRMREGGPFEAAFNRSEPSEPGADV